MKNRWILSGLIFLTIMFFSIMSFGGGFSVPEQGASSLGMAGAFIAKADDLSAIFHNPAGLTQLKGTHFYLSATGYGINGTYTRTGFPAEETKDDVIPVPLLEWRLI
jgi:long-chain fatty acid transport protein